MNNLKKLTALALSAAILLLSVITASAAGSYFLSEGFYYGIENKQAYVHGYQGDESEVIIREKFLSYYVTAVESFAFFRNDVIETLSLYDATQLASLGQCSFAECPNLRYVEIPSSVQEMGASVFDGCTSLSYVRFREDSATTLPSQAFFECASLKTVLFENSLTDIGAHAFDSCTSLEELELPATVTTIGDYAFADCDSLQKILIPASVTTISDTAFLDSDLVTIYCYYGSAAHTYAMQKEIDYVLLDPPYDIADAQITVAEAAVRYDGAAHEPTVTVTYEGAPLTPGVDYTLAFTDNTEPGEATVTITGKGEYGGEESRSFSIQNVLGDVDGNGYVEVVDATIIQRELASIATLFTDRAYALGDVNADGLDITDATFILRWQAELFVPYPINEMTDITV